MCLYIVWSVRVRAIYSLLRVHDRAFRIESLEMGNLQNMSDVRPENDIYPLLRFNQIRQEIFE